MGHCVVIALHSVFVSSLVTISDLPVRFWKKKNVSRHRLFGVTGNCAACSKLIPAFEMVMRAKDNVYHLDCFACQLCNQRYARSFPFGFSKTAKVSLLALYLIGGNYIRTLYLGQFNLSIFLFSANVYSVPETNHWAGS